MLNNLKCLGLDALLEGDEGFSLLLNIAANKGEAMMGYYKNCFTINHHLGNPQIILTADINDDKKQVEIGEANFHASGSTIWKCRIQHSLDSGNDAKTVKKLLIGKNSEPGCMVGVNVVNAHVLPSYAENECISLQTIAFPQEIAYFRTEEEYNKSLPKDDSGRTWGLDDGTIFPLGFMDNHMVKADDTTRNDDIDEETECINALRGVVKGIRWRKIVLDEKNKIEKAYISCFVGTKMGDLEIIHTPDMLSETSIQSLKVGSIVSGVFYIQGDAAILKYDHGFVCDEENNLALLRAIIMGDDPQKLEIVLSDDCFYYAGFNSKSYTNPKEILERFQYIHDNSDEKTTAYYATIISAENSDIEVVEGQNFLVLKRDNYNDTYMFIKLDNNNKIKEIETTDVQTFCYTLFDNDLLIADGGDEDDGIIF